MKNDCEKLIDFFENKNKTISEWLSNARYYIAVKSTQDGWNGDADEKRMREISTTLSNAYIAISDTIDNLRKFNELNKAQGG